MVHTNDKMLTDRKHAAHLLVEKLIGYKDSITLILQNRFQFISGILQANIYTVRVRYASTMILMTRTSCLSKLYNQAEVSHY